MARSYLVRSLPLVVLIAAGAVLLLVAGDETVVLALGVGAIGIAVVLLVSLLFYEVGRSEDRARAAERRRDGRP